MKPLCKNKGVANQGVFCRGISTFREFKYIPESARIWYIWLIPNSVDEFYSNRHLTIFKGVKLG